jgi:CHRD domain
MNGRLPNSTAIAFVIACTTTTSLVVFAFIILLLVSIPAYSSVGEEKFWAGLEGEFEVPPIDTNASGMAMFMATQDSIWYMINVTGINNLTSAHIHSGNYGENGPTVASLFSSDIPTENMNGTLIQGNITANMLQGPLLDKQLSELVLEMQNNSTYANVNTALYPNGEIRGQIMSANLTHADIMMG